MHYKKIILIFVVLSLITGCGMFNRGGGPSTTISSSELHKGTDGIIMEFIEEAPPSELYESTGFYARALLNNRGSFDVKDGYLLLGVEKGYIEIEKEVERYSLKGKSVTNPVGEQNFYEFKLKAKAIDKQSEQHKTAVFLTTCYEYQTEAITEACIDPDFYSLRPVNKACEIKDISLSDQGAPVAVTKIEQKMLQDADEGIVKPEFMIYVGNKGNGEVIDKEKIKEVCSSAGVDYKTWNTISVNAFLFDRQLNCRPKKESDQSKTGYIRLKNKEDFIRCVDERGIEINKPSYTTPLRIVLGYGYTNTISKEVDIKREMSY